MLYVLPSGLLVARCLRFQVEQMHVGNAVAHLVASKVLDIPGLWALAHNTTLARFDQLWASNVFLHMPASLLVRVVLSRTVLAARRPVDVISETTSRVVASIDT